MKYIIIFLFPISLFAQDSAAIERAAFLQSLKQSISESTGIFVGEGFSDAELNEVITAVEQNDNIIEFSASDAIINNPAFAERVKKQREIKSNGKVCAEVSNAESLSFRGKHCFRNRECNAENENKIKFRIEGDYQVTGRGYELDGQHLAITSNGYNFCIDGTFNITLIEGEKADFLITKK